MASPKRYKLTLEAGEYELLLDILDHVRTYGVGGPEHDVDLRPMDRSSGGMRLLRLVEDVREADVVAVQNAYLQTMEGSHEDRPSR